MKSFALFAAICAVALSAGATNAATIDPITLSLSDTTLTGPVLSFTAGPTLDTASFTTPIDALSVIIARDTQEGRLIFEADFAFPLETLEFQDVIFSAFAVAVAGPNGEPIDDVSFKFAKETVVPTNATPLPSALPLFATGLGGLGLFGWAHIRNHKSHAVVVA